MIKKILLFTVILPITTVLLWTIPVSKTFASDQNNLYLYSNEVVEQMSTERIVSENFLNEIRQSESDSNKQKNSIKYYTKQVFETITSKKFEKEPFFEEILTHYANNKNYKKDNTHKGRYLGGYISQIYGKNKKDIVNQEFVSDILPIKVQTKEKALLTENMIEGIFESLEKEVPTKDYSLVIAERRNTGQPKKANLTTNILDKILGDSKTDRKETNYNNLLSFITYTHIQDTTLSEEKSIIEEQDDFLVAETTTIKTDTEDVKTDTMEPETVVKEEKSVNSNTTTVTLSLKIIPVRFVYLNDEYEIVKIWNNVKEEDQVYALKFYKEDEKTELIVGDDVRAEYFEIVKETDIFKQGIIYTQNSEKGIQKNYARNLEIDFNNTPAGIEEIHTLM